MDRVSDEFDPDEFNREEFQRFRTVEPDVRWKSIFPSTVSVDLMARGKQFMLYSYQLFIQHFLNPNTQYKRLLLNHGTGSGKTITAISVALKFIQAYRKEDKFSATGTIFVLGFTEDIFFHDLIKYPELQFITHEEQERYRALSARVIKSESTEAAASLRELNVRIRKRFNNRVGNGFFVFIGYRAFFNRMFANANGSAIDAALTEVEILQAIADKKIIVNQPLLDRLKNSLMICDEVHKVYNSMEKNNWGVSIQYALDNVPSLRALFMSATPLNNSPTEICDLLNLLKSRRIDKSELFNKREELIPGALEHIGKLSYGHVSFLVDLNRHGFPARLIDGEAIEGIPHIKFIKTPMSDLQWQTLKKMPDQMITRDDMHLLDIVFPNPESNAVGLSNTMGIKNALESASDSWKSKNKISIEGDDITGGFLRRETLGIYSSKYLYLLDAVLECIKQGNGKIFIYHQLVHISGLKLIGEILSQNGICNESATPHPTSLCICGRIMREHVPREHAGSDEWRCSGVFKPVRYTTIYGELAPGFVQTHMNKFNSPDNTDGGSLMILLGSRKLQEGYDLKAVREVFVAGRPENIPTMKQILGRAIRKNSHYLLPPEKRTVRIRILLGTLPVKEAKILDPRQYEVLRYVRKMGHYLIIQKIEKVLHEQAVDINRLDTPEYRKNVKKAYDEFDMLPVIPPVTKKDIYFDPSRYDAFYSNEKLEETIWLIKRLFIEYSPIWTHEDLWFAVQTPPVTVEWKPIKDQNLFITALEMLAVRSTDNMNNLYNYQIEPKYLMHESMLNPNEKVLYYSQQDTRVITKVGDYYIAAPMQIESNAARENISLLTTSTANTIDYDCFCRQSRMLKTQQISVDAFLSEHKSVTGYDDQKARFITKWEHVSINNMEIAICDFGIDFHERFIEECIEYIFAVWCGVPKGTAGAPANAPDPRKKSKHHNFMFKMIVYYGIRGLIIWAHTARDYVYQNYKKYVTPVTSTLRDKKRELAAHKLVRDVSDATGLVNLLLSSINQNIFKWIPDETRAQYDHILAASLKRLEQGVHRWQRVPSDMLPIGHILKNLAKFWYLYGKPEWNSDPEYIKSPGLFVENTLIIGYDDKPRNSVNAHFKIRSPMQMIKKYRDARFIERGSVCMSKPKPFLIDLATKLEIGEKAELMKYNVIKLADEIRIKLIYNELRERIKRTNIKWFYFYYETQPKA